MKQILKDPELKDPKLKGLKSISNFDLTLRVRGCAIAIHESDGTDYLLSKVAIKWDNELMSRLENGKKAIERYEIVRKLTPREFGEIYRLNLDGEPFDTIIDNFMNRKIK